MQFRVWYLQQNEGFWQAVQVGYKAFRQELRRPQTEDFEDRLAKVTSEKDLLFALDLFYNKVAPRLDDACKEKCERQLASLLRKYGYGSDPKSLAKSLNLA